MTDEYDVTVIGLGGIGSAAACWASRQPNLRVLGLEQFDIGHPYGASEDVSRIIRRSYHRRDYVRLTRHAYEAWAELERESGTQVVFRTGGLDVGPREPAQGVAIDIGAYERAMDGERVSYERLEADEIMRRWPAWRLDERHVGLFQADAGIVDPSRANAAHRRLAEARGATLRARARVTRIVDAGDEIEVALEDGSRVTTGRLIVAADSWTNDLLEPLGLRLPLTITQEQVSWFAPAVGSDLFAPDRFPIWIWMDEPSFYGFPTHGEPGPKVGQDVGGREVTHRTRTFERDEEAHARVATFLAAHLPAMAVDPFRTKTCLYTLTPDRDLVIDTLPGHPAVQVLLGSAHAFKFASLLGRIAADRATGGHSDVDADLGAFRIDRPGLQATDPARSFVV